LEDLPNKACKDGVQWNWCKHHRGKVEPGWYKKVVYTSATLSLAALEIIVHNADWNELVEADYCSISCEIPDDCIEPLPSLPSDWRDPADPETLKMIGLRWVQSMTRLALRVPSAIIPHEANFVLSVEHPEFSKVSTSEPELFRFDRRLAKTL
jgi:RES domain-containing protein